MPPKQLPENLAFDYEEADLMDSNEKANHIAAHLQHLSTQTSEDRVLTVMRLVARYGRECLPIGLFKFHVESLIPVVKAADKSPTKWTGTKVRATFHWRNIQEYARNYWRQQAEILIKGAVGHSTSKRWTRVSAKRRKS